jgi:membrane-bound lytic murein transglycosylase MltF
MAFLDIPGKDRRIWYVIETGSRQWWQKFRPVGRQAAYHKQIKMKFTEKLQRRTRNVIITLTIICLTPLCEKGRKLSGAHSVNAFAGEELVCAIDLGNEMYSSHGLETGLSYRLVSEFAKDNHCNVRIVAAGSKENYIDSLLKGRVDILITNDIKQVAASDSIHILSEMNKRSVWAVSDSDQDRIRQFNSWIGHMKGSDEYDDLNAIYSATLNPHKRAEKGIQTTRISPYDTLIKKYAKTLGWDWRMVAAVVYQESKFSISSTSSRGAQGLMQVMPQTGARYGVDNLLDPEQNIHAGTSHLCRLQKMFSKYDLSHEELVKFTLAAYNAGEGRIIDCRNLAAAKGMDNTRWEEIVKVIPLMREDSILEEESVKLGKFQGHETIAYIDNVMSHYDAICQICPTSF